MKLNLFCLVLSISVVFGRGPGDGHECCSNGNYTDTLSLACNNPNIANYGDNQCYGDLLILCGVRFLSPDPSITGAYSEHSNLDTCSEFCKEFFPGLYIAATQFGDPGQCSCLSSTDTDISDPGYAAIADCTVEG
jgi:hypothetical protein